MVRVKGRGGNKSVYLLSNVEQVYDSNMNFNQLNNHSINTLIYDNIAYVVV